MRMGEGRQRSRRSFRWTRHCPGKAQVGMNISSAKVRVRLICYETLFECCARPSKQLAR
jgi:hypothetical protein